MADSIDRLKVYRANLQAKGHAREAAIVQRCIELVREKPKPNPPKIGTVWRK